MAQNKGLSLGGMGSPCCCGGGTPSCTCSPCAIPEQNLTISWVNPLAGNGSDTLVYGGSCSNGWTTGCSGGAGTGNQLIFQLTCVGGATVLKVIYFTSGSCPTGQRASCANNQSSPFTLTLASHTCGSGFTLVFTVSNSGCPAVAGSGYTSFTITL